MRRPAGLATGSQGASADGLVAILCITELDTRQSKLIAGTMREATAKPSVAVKLDDAVSAVLVSLRLRPEEAPEAIWPPWRAWRGHCANFRAKSFGQR